jgi:hypothetical protein
VALGEDVQELGAPLRGALDVELDVFECLHACKNAPRAQLIPGRRLRRT